MIHLIRSLPLPVLTRLTRAWEISLPEPFPETSEDLAEGNDWLPELPGTLREHRE
jgi:hypothetical protein